MNPTRVNALTEAEEKEIQELEVKIAAAKAAKAAKANATFIDRALPMIARNIPVILLRPKTKIAAQPEWQNVASTDADTIRQWNSVCPEGNCGCVAKLQAGAIFFFEVDDNDVLVRIKGDTGKEIPDTYKVRSSPGKGHFYFRHTAKSVATGSIGQNAVKNNDWSLRAHNAYVCAPLSIHPVSGLRYETVCDAPIIDVPDWLIDWCESQRVAKKVDASLTGDKIPFGSHDTELTRIAGTLRNAGCEPDGIADQLIKICEARCENYGSDYKEMCEKIAHSIGKKPVGKNDIAYIGSSHGTAPESDSSLTLIKASEIKPESQKWLWLNRIPADTITGLVGEPDKGKSLVTNDIAARLTTGQPFPDGSPNPFGAPVEVLMLVAEDSLKSTAVPRLIQAGADLTKIHFLDSVLLNQGGTKIKKQLALDTDLPAIRTTLLANPNIRLVIVDTVTSYTGNANQYKDSEMRKILLPFRDLAEETGVTLITIAHFNKNDKSSAMNRTGGSIAITAIPRAVWCCVADPEQDDRQLFLRVKGNLGKKLHGLSYTIHEAFIDIGEPKPASVPNLVWGKEPVERGADDVLVTSSDPQERGVGKAEKFLKEFLADGKPHLSQKVFDLAREAGVGEVAIKRARKRLHIQSRNLGMRWWMRLPNEYNHSDKAPWLIESQDA